MKKLLFASYDLNIGGIETSLVTLLNMLASKEYEITLVLEKKQGIFLDELNEKITIVEYAPNNSKNILIRKVINLVKRIKFVSKYKNKFDFAASYATYSFMSSFVARTASPNCALWVHNNYMDLYDNEVIEYQDFFIKRRVGEFKHIVFVSRKALDTFIHIFPQLKEKSIFINNLIDDKKIKALAKEKIEIKKEKNVVTFLNIGRHDEKQKKLTRLISASKKLSLEGYKFRVLLLGDGPDTQGYEALVSSHGLEDVFFFIGRTKNPFPYYQISDCVILTSDYEGYPVIFIESMVLNKPMITTDVSDAKEDIENHYGVVVKKEEEAIYLAMKEFIKNGYTIKEKFNPEQFNNEIAQKIQKLLL